MPVQPNRFGNYYERAAYRALNKRTPEAIAAEKAEKLRLSKTCQICGRAIFAETGTIAHHGYERPYEGHQTSSCPGAKKLPFEVSSDELKRHIKNQESFVATLIENRDKLDADEIPASFTWSYHDRTQGYSRQSKRFKTVSVTADTFEAIRDENADIFRQYSMHSFARMKEADLSNRNRTIKSHQEYITHQKSRLRAWSGPTFKRENGEWVAL